MCICSKRGDASLISSDGLGHSSKPDWGSHAPVGIDRGLPACRELASAHKELEDLAGANNSLHVQLQQAEQRAGAAEVCLPQRLIERERHASVLQTALSCRLHGVHAPASKYDLNDTLSVRQVQEQELAAARQETEALQQQLADQRSSLSQLLKEAQAENSGLRIALAKAQATFGAHQQAVEVRVGAEWVHATHPVLVRGSQRST